MPLPIVFSSILAMAKPLSRLMTDWRDHADRSSDPRRLDSFQLARTIILRLVNATFEIVITISAYAVLYFMLALALPIRWGRVIANKRKTQSRPIREVESRFSIKDDDGWFGAFDFMTSEIADVDIYANPAQEMNELIELILRSAFDSAGSTWVSVSEKSGIFVSRIDYCPGDYEIADALQGGLGAALEEILAAAARKYGVRSKLEIYPLPRRSKFGYRN